MKMLLMFLFSVFTMTAQAYVVPVYRDLKPASQVMIEKQDIVNPLAADADLVENEAAGGTSAAAATLSSGFDAQPDVPRNIVITPSGTTTDIESCVIVVNGTNINNAVISENFTFAANATLATTGAKAFKSVTSVVFPADCESGGFAATWDIGVGEKLGLKRCMAAAGDWAWSTVGGVFESTRATVVADADEIEKNTADFNGTMDGAADFVGYFIQNFACLP